MATGRVKVDQAWSPTVVLVIFLKSSSKKIWTKIVYIKYISKCEQNCAHMYNKMKLIHLFSYFDSVARETVKLV